MKDRLPLASWCADAGVVAALVAGAGLVLAPAYGAAALVAVLIVGAVAGALAGLLPAVLRWPAWTSVPLAMACYLLFGAVAVPATAVGAVLPSLETVRLLSIGTVSSWKQMLTVAVPIGSSGALLVPAYLTALVFSCAGVVVALRTRFPLAALAFPAAMGIAAALLGSSSSFRPAIVGTVVGLGALVWAAWRRRREGRPGLDARRPLALAAVLVPAVASGLYFGPQVLADSDRATVREVVEPPYVPQSLASPLGGFRTYVKTERDTVLLTVGGLPKDGVLRLAVMDEYTGVLYGTSAGTAVFNRVGDQIDDVPPGSPATVDVSLVDYSGIWLPSAGHLAGVTFTGSRAAQLTEDFRYDDRAAAGLITSGLQAGDGYQLEVSIPVRPDDARLAELPVQQIQQPDPVKVPEEIKTKAAEWAAQADNPFEIAAALEAGLRNTGYVSHGLDGALGSAAGHGADRIKRLLTAPTMVGDQEQYAVAMALMARSQGLPARVVMGFEPEVTGSASAVEVRGKDVTAWVEIPFEGVGWVAFHPTPSESKVPQQKEEDVSAAKPKNEVQPPPPQPDPRDPKAEPVEENENEEPEEEEVPEESVAPESASSRWGKYLLIGASPLVLLLIPALLILLLKALRRRRRRTGPPEQRIAGGWAQILDAATDLGTPVTRGRTRAEAAAAVDESFGGGTLLLAKEADRRVWAPEPVEPEEAERFWTRVDSEIAGMAQAQSWSRRMRGRFSTASLRRKP